MVGLSSMLCSNLQFMTVGEKIKLIRKSKGYSQDYLSFVLGISQNDYSRIERSGNNISIKMFFEIVSILEVDVDSVLNEVFTKSVLDQSRHYLSLTNELFQ